VTDTDAAAVAASSARPGALIGYARCSTEAQDTDVPRAALAWYGVPAGRVPTGRVYVDDGFTGTSRPGLDQALAALHGPAHGPDTGSHEVVHLGGHAAVVVPLADFMRLRALERLASAQELKDAGDTAALQEWRAQEAAGQTSYVPADEVWQRLGLTR
jgi:Resolvase, N terminal domain